MFASDCCLTSMMPTLIIMDKTTVAMTTLTTVSMNTIVIAMT